MLESNQYPEGKATISKANNGVHVRTCRTSQQNNAAHDATMPSKHDEKATENSYLPKLCLPASVPHAVLVYFDMGCLMAGFVLITHPPRR